MIARLAIAVIALHVLDDNFVQPQPGTSASGHLVSGLVPLAGLAVAAWALPRLQGARGGALALALGVFGVVAGIEAVHYASTVGPSGDDFTGLLAIPAGAVLLATGVATLWRTRRTGDRRVWRYGRRALLGVAAVVVANVIALPIGLGYITTHTARSVVPANHLGVAHENVSFRTADALRLRGWYIPSRNGAAVIAFPGRNGPQKPARMLARHGYGVLLFDRRGEGESDGDPNAWGWGGDEDIKAAVRYLQSRPDVDPERIGGIGLSVGGELMLEAAAETPELAAVVSEGAGARMYTEEMREDMPATDRPLMAVSAWVKQAAVAVFSNQSPPTDLRELVGRIAPRPLLLIAAPEHGVGEELNRGYASAAGETATLWEIPESRHVGGIDARPREYERRVVGFFDQALR
ncbi:MAG TPA: alpha/beta fold hydrolase [Solirubrobacteraceae bacterium]|nr:alpha/beta fold hydrolase [Solirubrobacteraceae bacterium]